MHDRIIRLPEVLQRTGLSRTSLYSAMQRGDFPQPVKIGARAVGWNESAVDAWISSRKAAA